MLWNGLVTCSVYNKHKRFVLKDIFFSLYEKVVNALVMMEGVQCHCDLTDCPKVDLNLYWEAVRCPFNLIDCLYNMAVLCSTSLRNNLIYFIPSSEFNAYLKQIKVILSAVKRDRIFSLVTNTIYIFSL